MVLMMLMMIMMMDCAQIEFWDHLSVHYSEDKLFRCDRCPFRTPLKHHMTSHRMNHDDDKPFSCDLCSYRAVSQSMVNSHKKSHSTVRPYVCDYPHCHYATKFVNQLTKHQEKQHPGFVPPVDGGARRRRQSTSVPPIAAQSRNLCYPDDRVSGLPPTVLRHAGPPSLPDELTTRSGAPMMPWSMPPWSPFNFLQRMAAAAAVSGLPLCAPSPMSLSAQRPANVKPFQLPPSTLPSSQSLETVAGERGSTSTPQKTFGGLRDLLHGGGLSSPLSTTAASEMDPRSSSLARLAAATAGAKNHVNIAGDNATTGALAVPRALAPAADDSEVIQAPKTLISSRSCLRSNVDGVSNNHQSLSGGDLSKCTSISGPSRHTVDDDHPLDLTAKTSVTAVPQEHPPDVCQPAEKDRSGTSGLDQLSVRKVSRRKGVAHKLDTTSVNHWPAADVMNEPFDLVPLLTSSQNASGTQFQSADSQRPSSRGTSSPGYRGLSGSPQNAGEVTLNGSEDELNDTSSATEKDHTKTSAGIQRQLEVAEVGDITRGDDAKVVDVSACRMPDVADGVRASTPRGNECHHCGFVFKHAAMFDIHMGFHKFDDPWRCNRCGQRCADRVDFNRHIATAPHPAQI